MTLHKCRLADFPTDDRPTTTRTEWINPDHIETAAGYITWTALEPDLWLELTMASGAVHYLHVGPAPALELDDAINDAIRNLLRT